MQLQSILMCALLLYSSPKRSSFSTFKYLFFVFFVQNLIYYCKYPILMFDTDIPLNFYAGVPGWHNKKTFCNSIVRL